MHSIEREGTLVYYIQLLCDESYFYSLLDSVSVLLKESLKEPVMYDGILEYDITFQSKEIVLQYDPALGVTMYMNSMDMATTEELATLADFATLITPLV